MGAKHKNCDCIFCNSKCPECGSTDIRVKYLIEYEYENHMEDHITVSQDIAGVYLLCNSCGEEMSDSISFWVDDYSFHISEPDERLEPLSKALFEVYPNLKEFSYKGGGEISVSDSTVKSVYTEAITCPHCGKKTIEGSKCHRCGKEIERG